MQDNMDHAVFPEPGGKSQDGQALMYPAGQVLQRLRQAVNVPVIFKRAQSSEGRTLTHRVLMNQLRHKETFLRRGP